MVTVEPPKRPDEVYDSPTKQGEDLESEVKEGYELHENLYNALSSVMEAVKDRNYELIAKHGDKFRKHLDKYKSDIKKDELHPEIKMMNDCYSILQEGVEALKDPTKIDNFHEHYDNAVAAYKLISENYTPEGQHKENI